MKKTWAFQELEMDNWEKAQRALEEVEGA